MDPTESVPAPLTGLAPRPVVATVASSRLSRRYWKFTAAAGASSAGDGLLLSALPLLAASLTKDPLLVAAVLGAQRFPWLFLGLPAGVWVDRLDRARIMRVADVARFLVLVVLSALLLLGFLGVWALFLLVLLLASAEPFFMGASRALLPSLVGTDQLARANGTLGTVQCAGEQAAGPALGGLLFTAARSVPFLGDALTFLCSAWLLTGLGSSSRVSTPPRSPLRVEMRAGFRWFVRSRPIVVLTGLIASMAFCQAMVMGVLVLFALERLHLSEVGFGLLLTAGALGNIIGGLLTERIVSRLGMTGTIIAGGMLAGAVYIAVSGLSSPYLAGGLLFLEGFGIICGNASSTSLRQLLIPDDLLGRVGNVMSVAIWGTLPIGALLGGVVAREWGTQTSLLLAGALQCGLVAIGALPLLRATSPVLRALKRRNRHPSAAV